MIGKLCVFFRDKWKSEEKKDVTSVIEFGLVFLISYFFILVQMSDLSTHFGEMAKQSQ